MANIKYTCPSKSDFLLARINLGAHTKIHDHFFSSLPKESNDFDLSPVISSRCKGGKRVLSSYVRESETFMEYLGSTSFSESSYDDYHMTTITDLLTTARECLP